MSWCLHYFVILPSKEVSCDHWFTSKICWQFSILSLFLWLRDEMQCSLVWIIHPKIAKMKFIWMRKRTGTCFDPAVSQCYIILKHQFHPTWYGRWFGKHSVHLLWRWWYGAVSVSLYMCSFSYMISGSRSQHFRQKFILDLWKMQLFP